MNLFEWTKHHITFKDCIKKQIVEIREVNTNELEVIEKKTTKHYVISSSLATCLELLHAKGIEFIVTTHTEKNITTLLKEWHTLSSKVNVTIIFANAHTNESVLIHPKTHNLIHDADSFEQGLKSIISNVTQE